MKIKFLALGDSYTIGESVAEHSRWPVQLQNQLDTYGYVLEDPKITATTGWTTSDLIRGIHSDIYSPPYDMVSLSIGVNNQYRNEDKEKYRIELTELIFQAIDFAGGRKEKVFLISIPDWGVTPFARGKDLEHIASEIDIFNRIKEKQCLQVGVPFINITEISRIAKTDPSFTAGDNLHPSGNMYKLWIRKILPVVLNILD